jgi:hypothetical protein
MDKLIFDFNTKQIKQTKQTPKRNAKNGTHISLNVK